MDNAILVAIENLRRAGLRALREKYREVLPDLSAERQDSFRGMSLVEILNAGRRRAALGIRELLKLKTQQPYRARDKKPRWV